MSPSRSRRCIPRSAPASMSAPARSMSWKRRPSGADRGAVLLVHGASGNFADLHVALADRLAAMGFRVFSVDRPGHGWSDRLAGRHGVFAGTAGRMDPRGASGARRRAGDRRRAFARRRARPRDGARTPRLRARPGAARAGQPSLARRRLLVLQARGLARVGPLFRWLVVPLAGMFSMPGGVRSVFEPGPTPENYIERTRLPLVLRPWHFRANAEDVVDIEGHVAVLSKRYGAIRAPTAIVTGDRDSVVYAHIHSAGCARDIPGATLRVLAGRRPFPALQRARGGDRGDPGGRAARATAVSEDEAGRGGDGARVKRAIGAIDKIRARLKARGFALPGNRRYEASFPMSSSRCSSSSRPRTRFRRARSSSSCARSTA